MTISIVDNWRKILKMRPVKTVAPIRYSVAIETRRFTRHRGQIRVYERHGTNAMRRVERLPELKPRAVARPNNIND